MENQVDWHGKKLEGAELIQARQEVMAHLNAMQGR
jgi:hypothetical protein